MGAGHAHALYVHEHSPLHRLAPEAKLVAAFGFVVAVAITPREALWAFAAYGAAVGMLVWLGRLGVGFVLARMLAVAPFIVFALLIPFIASGERVEVLGVSVSRAGLWGMWNIVAKATLGIATSIVLTATTEVSELLRGMARLRVPAPLVAIAGFMVRYLEVIADEVRRMRTAMTARAHDPRWLWQTRPIASAAGALFVRSYERGERVHAAMLARGFTGTMPQLRDGRSSTREWWVVAVFVAATLGLAVVALAVTR